MTQPHRGRAHMVRTREADLTLNWSGLLLPTAAGAPGRKCDMADCTNRGYTLVSERNGSILLLCPGDAELYVGREVLSASMRPHGLLSPRRPQGRWPWSS